MGSLEKIDLFLKNYGKHILILAIIFYTVLFSFLSLWKYHNFEYNAMDLAIINQVFYNSSLGKAFVSSIHPPSYLGDHFTPIIFLILPFYHLYKSAETLLLLQTIILALAAWPLYLIAKKILGQSWAAVLGLVWLLNPFVQNINLFEFSFLPFAVFLIFWAFYFYQKEQFIAFLFFCFLALLVREDIALVIFMLGAIALFKKRRVKWWLAPITIATIYFFAAIKIAGVFAPSEGYKFFIYYSWLGNTWGEALKTLATKPWLGLFYGLRPNNFIFSAGLLLPFTFLPLLAPFYLLLGLGIFLQLTLGASGGSEVLLKTHYVSLLLPAVFIAAIYSLKKITERKGHRALINFIFKHKDLAALIFAAGIIYSMSTLGPIPGSLKIIYKDGLLSQESLAKKSLLDQIPAEAPVATTYETLPSLSGRENIYSFNYVFLGQKQFLSKPYRLPENTEYLLLDFRDLLTYKLQYGSNPFYKAAYQKALAEWTEVFDGFGITRVEGGLALFERSAENKFNLIAEAAELNLPAKQKINDELTLINTRSEGKNYEFWWEINSSPELYFLKINYGDDINEYWPLGWGLLTEEHVGKKIQTNYWFGDGVQKIEVVDVISGGIAVAANRSTKNVIDEEKVLAEIFSLK
ncbi:DUF2079 domain-containing protein [Candidatus Falkowbacteria bacterium]|nr:DUF2079 domain-containing protein [Candidatus Falkowbacteria bacterium]